MIHWGWAQRGKGDFSYRAGNETGARVWIERVETERKICGQPSCFYTAGLPGNLLELGPWTKQ